MSTEAVWKRETRERRETYNYPVTEPVVDLALSLVSLHDIIAELALPELWAIF